MSHGGPFVSQAGEVLYGYGYWKQKLTFTGEGGGVPTGGSVIFAWGRHKATTAVTWSAGLTAATVQTALRTIPEFSDCVVTKVVDNYTFVVDNSPAPHSTPALLYVASNTLSGGTRPYVSIVGYVDGATDNTKTPLTWKAELNIQNALPVADKLNVGTNESTMTKLASQWDVRAPLSLGRRELKEREDAQRIWDGNAITFIENQITKPFKKTTPTFSGGAITEYTAGYVEFNSKWVRVWLDYNNNFVNAHEHAFDQWDDGSTEWDVAISPATLVQVFQQKTVAVIVYGDHLYYGKSAGYGYLNTSFANTNVSATGGAAAWCIFDGKLVRMGNNGQLYFTTEQPASASFWEGPETAVIPDKSQPVAMTTFADHAGQLAIYVLTYSGLWWYDFPGATFKQQIALDARLSPFPSPEPIGMGQMTTRGDALYFIANGTIYEYKSNGQVRIIGPHTDQGLPNNSYLFNKRVRAWSLTTLNNWLVAGVSSYRPLAAGIPDAAELGATLGYNGHAWYVLAGPYNAKIGRASGHSSILAAEPKLFTGTGEFVLFNDAVGNPLHWESKTYEDTGTVITPWFDAAVTHIQHTALMGHLWCRNFTSTSTVESVKVYYQLDDCQDSTLTNIGNDPRKHWVQVLDADGSALNITPTTLGGQAGLVPFFFDRPAAPDPSATKFSQGIQFYKIRFRMDLSGGDAATNTPVVQFLSLQYIAQYPSTDAFSVRFTLENNIAGRTAQMQLNDFRLMHDLAPGQPFAWQDSELHIVKEMNYQSRNLSSGYLLSGTGPKPTITAVMSEQSVTLTEH